MMFIRLGIYLIIAYACLLTAVFLMQRKLLYYPGEFDTTPQLAEQHRLQLWPAASNFHGLFSEPSTVPVIGTVIIFHGNGGPAVFRQYYADALTPLGYRVILAEYPGYGGRPGKPAEKTLVADAVETIEQAFKLYDEPIYLLGESLGSGVAAAASAHTGAAVDGLILITPWDRLSSPAQHHYPYLPINWLLLDEYDSISNLDGYTGPVAVVVADKDQIIPKQFGLNLYNSIQGPKQLWQLADANHNDWHSHIDQDWWKQLMQYVSD